jgi:ketosteroid isomerase-like protein
MSRENVELARRGYEALNAALRTGNAQEALDAFCDPAIVLTPSGILPESKEMQGHDGMLRFLSVQTEALDDFFVEPQAFIDAGTRVVVPIRFGGRAQHTGIDVSFEVVHVLKARDGKWTHIDMYPNEAEALKAVGLAE